MGLLQPADWQAKWIRRINPEDGEDRSAIRWIWAEGQDPLATVPRTTVHFKTTLKISHKPRSATFFVAVHGAYKAKVNGHEVGSKSRWETFDRRDISDELIVGKNLIEVDATSPPGPEGKTTVGGFAALIKLTQPNGTIVRSSTKRGWKAQLETTAKWRSAQILGDLTDQRFGDPGPLPQPAAYLRKTLDITKTVQRARLYVTALGSYRVFLNGSQVGADVLTPGFTDYHKRVMYQTYDVTNQIVHGANVIGALLGDGWYGSPLTWSGVYFFAPTDRLVAQLELIYSDGSHDTVVTDHSWNTATSPILASQIYSGEVYDARLEKADWNKPDFDDSGWKPAVVSDAPHAVLTSQVDTPVQVIATIEPKTVKPSTNGAYIYDMGQNMVGWVTLKVKGAAGTNLRMRFAEILNPDGTIYTENLRNADATDTYILRGGDEETFTPHFTFHGFRYVEVTGYPGTPTLGAIRGDVVSSVSGETAARLTTSSDLVNRMWGIGLWGQRGNFVSIPTDCPQRDERLGWMGDAGVFWRTGSYNFNIAAFLFKTLWTRKPATAHLPTFRPTLCRETPTPKSELRDGEMRA
jgi:alpha-L-rhamnosidase